MSARTGVHRGGRQASCLLALALCFAFFAALPTPAHQSSSPASQSSQPPPQSSATTAASANASNAAEMNTRDTTIPLQSHVNVVPLRVVVRDAKGHTIENLRKEDFQVFEDGKLQDVSHFSIETPAAAVKTIARDDSAATAGTATATPGFVPPSRFVALLFLASTPGNLRLICSLT